MRVSIRRRRWRRRACQQACQQHFYGLGAGHAQREGSPGAGSSKPYQIHAGCRRLASTHLPHRAQHPPAPKFLPVAPRMTAVPPVMYSQPWSPQPSTTAEAPELRTQKRSAATPRK